MTLREPTQSDSSETVRLDAIGKSFGAFKAVDGVNLAFRSGETVGLVGPNGAGKTTLFGLMSGAHRASTGKVWLGGRDVTSWSPLRRARQGLARTFQTARVFSSLSVEEHLRLAMPQRGDRPTSWVRSRLSVAAAERCALRDRAAEYGLADVLDVSAASLPQAQRKILDLALALARKPSVLLLDEPTAGVTSEDVDIIGALLERLRQQHPDTTTIVSSHDVDLIARLCGRIVVLVRGQVLADGATEAVVQDDRVKAAYFGDSVHV